MKITKSQLKQIIKEELSAVMPEEEDPLSGPTAAGPVDDDPLSGPTAAGEPRSDLDARLDQLGKGILRNRKQMAAIRKAVAAIIKQRRA